jgi:hypothetical protein
LGDLETGKFFLARLDRANQIDLIGQIALIAQPVDNGLATTVCAFTGQFQETD